MNEAGGLLQNSAAFLWRNPVVLLPVLLARIVNFLTYVVCGLLKAPLMKAVAPRSVLGGFSGQVNMPVVLVAGFLTFLPLVCEVAVLVYAMVVCGRWAHAIRETGAAAERSWRVPAGAVARDAALTLGVGGITVFVGLYFSLRGGVPVRWSYVVTWCFVVMASWFLIPAWLRMLAQAEGVRFRDPPKWPAFLAVVLSFALFAACVRLGLVVQGSLVTAYKIQGAAWPFVVNVVAACLSAIPLAFSFVAMSRYVAERPGWQSE